MSEERFAYKSADQGVLDAWNKYAEELTDVRQRRAALADQFGRGLMVNSIGLGHGIKVVGFERFDSDEDGELIANGLLVAKKGANVVTPNKRRKAGKELAEELASYSSKGPVLPGMKDFLITGMLRAVSPAMHQHEGVVYAMWPCLLEGPSVPGDMWESVPLSEYYLSYEEAHPS